MEDIIEEFGSVFLSAAVALVFIGIWMENLKYGGVLCESVRQFLGGICGS